MKFARGTESRRPTRGCAQGAPRSADILVRSSFRGGAGESRTRRAFGACGGQECPRSEAPRPAAAGFTLAEVLAALVFMAILIPVALEGLSIASRAGEVAARKGEAALVAERVLTESIVTTNWNTSVQSGTLRQGIRDFRWTLRNDPWTYDAYQNAVRLLSVEVVYAAQGQDYSVRLSTLVDTASQFFSTNSLP